MLTRKKDPRRRLRRRERTNSKELRWKGTGGRLKGGGRRGSLKTRRKKRPKRSVSPRTEGTASKKRLCKKKKIKGFQGGGGKKRISSTSQKKGNLIEVPTAIKKGGKDKNSGFFGARRIYVGFSLSTIHLERGKEEGTEDILLGGKKH